MVDDDLSLAEALHLVLSMDRHRVEKVGDGETALAKYDGGGYDLVITDFLMPGMDGLELARLIKERARHTPVVLVTAHWERLSQLQQARLRHVDAVLEKPFSLEELNEVLRTVFPRG